MPVTFKALGLFLVYPEAELQAAYAPAVQLVAEEGLLGARALAGLRRLARQLASEDLLDLQSRYVQMFDRGRALSLNLYEHVHGESRDRGQAMAELKALYAVHGLELTARELPDHLPVFLEFLSTLPEHKAFGLLGEAGHVVAALAERLKRRKSPYAAVLAAIASLADFAAPSQALAGLMDEPEDDPDDLEALDRAWAEEPVHFGPGESGCPKTRELLSQLEAPSR